MPNRRGARYGDAFQRSARDVLRWSGIDQAKTAFVQTCVRHALAMKVNLEPDGADEGNLMLNGWLHDTWLIRR